MLIRPASDIRSSEITDESLYRDRRRWMKAVGVGLAGAAVASFLPGTPFLRDVQAQPALPGVKKGPFGTDEKLNSWEDITGYNNFYEFGVDKEDPARNAGKLTTRPWTVKVEGHCNKPGDYGIDDILKWFPLEERVYRLRCVEAWSMVIPWVGFPLGDFVKRMEPTGKAKFVEFTTLQRPPRCRGSGRRRSTGRTARACGWTRRCTRSPSSPWGCTARRCRTRTARRCASSCPGSTASRASSRSSGCASSTRSRGTSWNCPAPQEYGFYSNVNPEVDHPRWSQGRERRIGEFFRRKTLMFNGYADQVAGLYAGMDLKKNF